MNMNTANFTPTGGGLSGSKGGGMTKTEAIRQARQAVTMYRQGSGWIVSAWDEDVGCNRTSGEMTHPEARQSVTEARLVAAIRALGRDPIDADIFGGRGTLEARLHAWCEENP